MRTKMRTVLPGCDAYHPGASGPPVCPPEGPGGQRAPQPEAVLRSYLEQGLNATPAGSGSKRSAHTLPRVEGPLAISGQHLSNAALFYLLDA